MSSRLKRCDWLASPVSEVLVFTHPDQKYTLYTEIWLIVSGNWQETKLKGKE